MSLLKHRSKDVLLFDTFVLTIIFICLYTWKSILDGFVASNILYILINAVYIPLVIIWKRKFFCIYHVVYAYVLVATIILRRTLLYNNFTAYFIILSIAIIKPKWKTMIISLYFAIATIAFAVNEHHMVNYLIHLARAFYYYTIFNYFIFTRFTNNSNNLLNLTQDEIEILTQMAAGRKQKEIIGFSINTVTKKLLNARTRNDIDTTQELLIKFIQERNL